MKMQKQRPTHFPALVAYRITSDQKQGLSNIARLQGKQESTVLRDAVNLYLKAHKMMSSNARPDK